MLQIGPEDIGKEVILSSIKKEGVVTCFTSEHVWVRGVNDNRPQRYPRALCQYKNGHFYS